MIRSHIQESRNFGLPIYLSTPFNYHYLTLMLYNLYQYPDVNKLYQLLIEDDRYNCQKSKHRNVYSQTYSTPKKSKHKVKTPLVPNCKLHPTLYILQEHQTVNYSWNTHLSHVPQESPKQAEESSHKDLPPKYNP